MQGLDSQPTTILNNGPVSSNRFLVLQGVQKSNLGDERISFGSLNEMDKIDDEQMDK